MMLNKPLISGDPIELKIFTINNNMLDPYTEDKDGLLLMNSGIKI